MGVPTGSLDVGIVGPGAMGQRHAAALQAAGARVVAVAGPDAAETAEFATRFAVPARYQDPGDLSAHPGLDAVVIASPNELHAGQALAALANGLHVLCEIPVATSLHQAEQVARAAQAADRQVAVAHTLRYCTPYRRLKEQLAASSSTTRHVVARTLIHRQLDTGMNGRRRTWTDDVLWHHGGHLFDVVLWLLDASEAVVHGAQGPPWRGNGRPMDVGAVVVTPDGDLGTVALSYHSRLAERDLMVIGDDTTFRIAGGRLDGPDGVVADCGSLEGMEHEGLLRQDHDFVEALVAGRAPECVVGDVLPAMRVIGELAEGDE